MDRQKIGRNMIEKEVIAEAKALRRQLARGQTNGQEEPDTEMRPDFKGLMARVAEGRRTERERFGKRDRTLGRADLLLESLFLLTGTGILLFFSTDA